MGGVLATKAKRGTRNTARSKLTQDFIERLAADFRLYGEEVIEKLRTESPAKYAEVIAKLVPQELLIHQDDSADLSDMSLEELKAFMIEQMWELFGVRLAPDTTKQIAHTVPATERPEA